MQTEEYDEEGCFIRITWKLATELLKQTLHQRYGAKGEIRFMKSDRDAVGTMYNYPDWVEIDRK